MNNWLGCVMLLAWFIASPALGAERVDALQLYQEALFQETGTGDLSQAGTLYASIILNFPEHRDIVAVSYYHLGLIAEKLGQVKKAAHYFRIVMDQFPDHARLAKQAELKLQTLAPNPALAQTPGPAATPATVQRAPVPATAEKSLPEIPGLAAGMNQFGIGIHNAGLSASYRTLQSQELVILAEPFPEGWSFGVRGLYRIQWALTAPVSFYTGLEAKGYYPRELRPYYSTAGLAGVNLALTPDFYLGADVGYVYLNQSLPGIPKIDTLIKWSVQLTLYLF